MAFTTPPIQLWFLFLDMFMWLLEERQCRLGARRAGWTGGRSQSQAEGEARVFQPTRSGGEGEEGKRC